MFKHANPASRIPTYLQANTVENLVWQLKLAAVLVGGMIAVDYVRDRREQKRLTKND